MMTKKMDDLADGMGTPGFKVKDSDWLRLAADDAERAASENPVEVDPDVADYMGAFEETALTTEAALESLYDGPAPWDRSAAEKPEA